MTSRVTHMLSNTNIKDSLLFFGMPMVTIFGLSILVAVKVSNDLQLDSLFSIIVLLFVSVLGNMLFVIFQMLMIEIGSMLPSFGDWQGRTSKRHHIYNNEYSEQILEDARKISSIDVEKAKPVDDTENEPAVSVCIASGTKSPQHEEQTAESHETENTPIPNIQQTPEENIPQSTQSAATTSLFPIFNNKAYSKRYAEAERQRERRKAERQRAISEYILHTMSPYAALDELAVLHDELTAWMHDPEHKPKPVNLHDRRLTTMDLRHFIWNIAERLDDVRNYNGKNRAVFTKALFPETFADTEIDSIRNFTVNPNSGLIHIDRPDKGSFGFHYDAEDKMIH